MNDMQASKPVRLFSNRALLALLVPLVIERFLDIAVGMGDTIMVASVGETAVSAVSLVDNISTLVIQILAALATGGAVIISQYIGRDELRNARKAARQLVYTTVLFAMVLTVASLILRGQLLRLLFGRIEPVVMEQAQTYFFITAMSYPFIAIFNSSAALFRSMGNSRFSMYASLSMNLLNIVGNAVLIYGFNMGVAGAAISTLFSRVVASVVMLLLLRDHRNTVYLDRITRVTFNKKIIKNILNVGIPNGMENGMFQMGKIIVQSLVSTFGTAAIAANAVGGRIADLMLIPGSAISLAIITVVGQCIGARDHEQVQYYTKKLMGYVYLSTAIAGGIIFFTARPAAHLFNLSPEATNLAVEVLHIYVIVAMFLWPMSFPFANVLRAAGDVRFTMIVSVISMMVLRVGGSYFLAWTFKLGLLSTWIAMFADWVVRSLCFFLRYKSGKWKHVHVI